MRVYRIEDAKGHGPFGGSYILRQAISAANAGRGWEDEEPCPYRHPGPHDETALRDLDIHEGSPWHFGFRSVAALVRWFDSEAIRVELGKLGAVVAVYEVDPTFVVEGVWQLVFDKPQADRVETLAIPTLA